MKMSIKLLLVLSLITQVAQGWWRDNFKTGCSSGGCGEHRGNDWGEVSSTCCTFICIVREEECAVPRFQGIDDMGSAIEESTCRWNGCNGNNCDAGTEAEIHSSSCGILGGNELCCKPKNHENYLFKKLRKFGSKEPTLFDLPIVGTHHSPTSQTNEFCVGETFAKCQNFPISLQLKYGVRAFGFRPACRGNGAIDHYHGETREGIDFACYYFEIRNHLKVINDFLGGHPHEIVYLLFENFRDFSDDCTNSFRRILREGITNTQIITTADTRDGWPKVRDLINSHKRLIIFSNDVGKFESGTAHRWDWDNGSGSTNADATGSYHDTDNVSTLVNGVRAQAQAMRTRRTNSGQNGRRPFMFSHFYMTQKSVTGTPWNMAKDSGAELHRYGEFMQITPINVIWVDFVFEKKGHMLFPRVLSQLERSWSALPSTRNAEELVAFRSPKFNKFMQAHENGQTFGVPWLVDWETYVLVDRGDGKFAIQTGHGLYLKANQNGEIEQVPYVKTWETWSWTTNGEFKCLRSFHGTHIQFQPNDSRLILHKNCLSSENVEKVNVAAFRAQNSNNDNGIAGNDASSPRLAVKLAIGAIGLGAAMFIIVQVVKKRRNSSTGTSTSKNSLDEPTIPVANSTVHHPNMDGDFVPEL